MATRFPIYRLSISASNSIEFKSLKAIMERIAPGVDFDRFMIGDDQHGNWTINVPHELGKELAYRVAAAIEDQYDGVSVDVEDTYMHVMEEGDIELQRQGIKPPERDRGPLN